MPKPLHEILYDLVLGRDAKELAKRLPKSKEEAKMEVNRLSKYGASLLNAATSHDTELSLSCYECIILLLEAGADPLQPYPHDKMLLKNPTPFAMVLIDNHFALIRLFLWYLPGKYQDQEMHRLDGSREVAKDFVDIWDRIERKDPVYTYRAFKKWIDETASDVQEARRLARRAEMLSEAGAHKAAAEAYLAISEIYAKHARLELTAPGDPETTLIYYTHTPSFSFYVPPEAYRYAPPEEYRVVLGNFYQAKSQEHLEKAYVAYQKAEAALEKPALYSDIPSLNLDILEGLIVLSQKLHKESEAYDWYQRAEERLSQLVTYPDQASIDRHADILDQLISLSRSLAKGKEVRDAYLQRAAEVRMKEVGGTPPLSLPDLRTPQAVLLSLGRRPAAVAAEASEETAEERAPLISRAVLWSHPSPTKAGEEKEEARGAAAEAATLSLLS